MNTITSKDNKYVRELKKLLNSKKERRDRGLFVIEGIRALKEALQEKAEIEYVFFSCAAAEKYADMLPLIDERRLVLISDELSRSVSDSVSPQGIFAVCKSSLKTCLEFDNLDKVLLLDSVQDPGNLGTILRTADAVGVSDIVLCEGCCELYNPKTIRSTAGSVFRLNIAVADSFSEAVKTLKSCGFKLLASVVDKEALSLTAVDFSGRCAVVIGNEGNGIPDEHKIMCDEKITIRMSGNAESLNASAAAAIILWEMTKTKGEK